MPLLSEPEVGYGTYGANLVEKGEIMEEACIPYTANHQGMLGALSPSVWGTDGRAVSVAEVRH